MPIRIIPIIFFILIILFSIIQFGGVFEKKLYIFEILLCFSSFLCFTFFKFSKKILLIFLFYIPVLFFSLFNSFFSGDLLTFFTFLFYFIAILICIIFGSNLNSNQLKSILIAYICLNLIINILGLVFKNNSFFNAFSGVFYNPNAYGLFCSFSLVFVYLYSKVNKVKINIYFILFYFINSLGMLLSVSRLSLICCIISILFFILLDKFNLKILIINKNKFKILFILVFLCFVFYLTGLLDSFINKTVDLQDNLSNGRSDLWDTALMNMNFYGHGASYYKSGDVAVHNNYLNIGLLFGSTIAFSIIFFWICLIVFLLVNYYLTSSKYVLLSISILLYGLIYWMFEIGSSFVFVWVLFMLIGYSCFNVSKK